MSSRAQAFIVNIESDLDDVELLDTLGRLGLAVDREYGVIKIDPKGAQRVTRVTATEEQLESAQSAVRFSFFPDLKVSKSPL